MDVNQKILHYYRVEGMSLREFARKLNIDKKTVIRQIKNYEAAIKANPDTGMEDFLATLPKYKKRKYVAKLMKGDVVKEIDKWLKENERRRSAGMRKQCLKCTDIHRQLIEKGYTVSYS